ncbi:KpsF/GutQ family sugar-phosphate isomerase [Endozoicomonas sp. SM1973]|uniref:Arabinose 5-phosphate isomerase n=1 Tax=Spartinivicinus marinus TaxID=2994442 RepID=A0A853I827_9GAMM|nr:KpsF/GutQ family sugar-phosphate isomerase [Spartinivicinus marinus]MCX4025724.1 KpsF/GutQ family sugar-phosphate isomerase [Spartinivicinus marinus]NYZ65717.1 KpsF/GutQ family sugar-phosphate isomerase [Spartinivicinus marinus]
MSHDIDFAQSAIRTIKSERDAIDKLIPRIDGTFTQACQIMLNCKGRVVVVGMGKSGHIGNKIAATLASTGTPAFFVHPGEASHGDMGMITADDVVLALSNSGNTAELVMLIPLLKRLGTPLISMTGNENSALAQAADVNLDTYVEKEACPLDLAPTSSTTVSLVLGDALAIALLEAKGFTPEDFAFSHPGGSLGRKLLLKVTDIMHTGQQLPIVSLSTPLKEALIVISQKGLGMTAIADSQSQLLGVFTDGDLRRVLDQELNLHTTPISQVMTTQCKTVNADMLAAEALNIMEDHKITNLVVVNQQNKIEGVIHLHDIIKAGVV